MPKYSVEEIKYIFSHADVGQPDFGLRFSEVATYFKDHGIEFDRIKAKHLFQTCDKGGFRNAGTDSKLQFEEFVQFMNKLFP